MTRHTPETVAGTLLLLISGAVLFTLSRIWGVDGSLARQAAAFGGPLALVLAVGMAIHGRAMPTTHISTPARAWGVLGSVASILNLWSLGYFEQGLRLGRTARLLMPVVLIAAWFLPKRFYGADPAEAAGSGTAPQGNVH